uniref:Transmembrane protein 230 n=1 Tax=Mantoniella antarctica TaxID=81844 RepID=A0A7S0T1T8_9CHLO|mmetsp:Transcript_8165/g.20249  ORF Transcript_8165/g.20249 Transcript_8165/m.20249 type:complete len:118 (+) Transcript_8165:232-585(+)
MQRHARRYQRVDDADHPADHDPRFDVPEYMNPKLRKPSKKTVALAFGLLMVGSILLTCYALYATGHMPLPKNEERGTSLAILVLGCITLAPGLYVSVILVAVWRGVPGFSYDMIPQE